MRSTERARIVLVEPNDLARAILHQSACALGAVESFGHFEDARTRLKLGALDFLITNIRLGAYNGLHLAYLMTPGPYGPHAIVYSDERDPGLAREVQQAGAFYEVAATLPVTMTAYVTQVLPPSDRRDGSSLDRRTAFRGGRRCWDQHLTRQQMH